MQIYNSGTLKYCNKCGRILCETSRGLWCPNCGIYCKGEDQSNMKFLEKQDDLFDDKEYLTQLKNVYQKDHKKDVQTSYVKCCKEIHNQDNVAIGPYTIWCSEYPGNKKVQRRIPDLGIYLASVWMDISPVWSTGTRRGINFGLAMYPAVFIDWADMDVVDFEVLCKTVDYAIMHLKRNKKVEIGCFGGHGRTGTFLACIMAKVEGLSGQDAINKVRETYCHSAIETKRQEDLIKRYAEYIS